MSRDRFVFIFVCFALAGFTPSHSLAAKSNSFGSSVINEQTMFGNNLVSSSRPELTNPAFQDALKQKAMQRGLGGHRRLYPKVYPLGLHQEAIAQANSPNPQPPQKINRLWFFGGMAVTSSIALFLTWILFSKPQQQEKDLASELTSISSINQNKAKVKTLSREPSGNQGTENGIVTQFDVNSGADTFTHNSLKVKESLIQSKISQFDSPIADIDADIDVVQELINDLQHHHNYPDGDLNNYNSDSKTFPVSSSPHISIRRKAIGKLAKVGDYRSIEPLLKIMPQVGASDKSLIFKAVTQINQRTFYPINSELFVALQNEHPEVRLNALQDLKSLYQFVSPVITQIAQMQSDQDYEVRQTATQVLRQLNASPLPTFNNCSEDDDLIVGKESEANLHLVAYLLAELDAERQ